MATIIVMPALGNSVESCLINSWLVKEGDTVSENDILCDVETDKAAMDVPSTASGTVLKLLWAEGDDVPVKVPLLIVGDAGEDISPLLKDIDGNHDEAEAAADDGVDVAPAAGEAGNEPVAEESAPAAASSGDIPSSPRARSYANEQNVAMDAIDGGTGPGGRIIERDVKAAIENGAATATAARSGALGSGAEGTGIGGRISTTDLAPKAERDAEPVQAPSPVASSGPAVGDYTDTPLKGIRKVISERMMDSLASSAQLTYTSTANAEALQALRKKLKASDESLGLNGITIGDLVGYAAVRTVLKHSTHNAHVVDGVLREFNVVHMGFACDTPRGLLVPVVKEASRMTLREFSERSKDLAHQAIEGGISPDDLNGATFTVTNLGGFGIESFTPILNAPQTAILGVDAIFPRAKVLEDGSVGAENRIGFSLTADHRVIDGADAARFLQDLVRYVENIELMILG